MADVKSTTPPTHPCVTRSEHLERAAFHLYEAGREFRVEQHEWDADEAGDARTDCRYRMRLAERKGIPTVPLAAIEVLAATLAVADGEVWPACRRAINPAWPDAQQRAIAASRRQRYRHLARLAHADLMRFYELGTESETERHDIIRRALAQHADDAVILKAWRRQIGFPSTVTQLHKESDS